MVLQVQDNSSKEGARGKHSIAEGSADEEARQGVNLDRLYGRGVHVKRTFPKTATTLACQRPRPVLTAVRVRYIIKKSGLLNVKL